MRPSIFILFFILLPSAAGLAVAPSSLDLSETTRILVINNLDQKVNYRIDFPEWVNISCNSFSLNRSGRKEIFLYPLDDKAHIGEISVQEDLGLIKNTIIVKIKQDRKHSKRSYLVWSLLIITVIFVVSILKIRVKRRRISQG